MLSNNNVKQINYYKKISHNKKHEIQKYKINLKRNNKKIKYS